MLKPLKTYNTIKDNTVWSLSSARLLDIMASRSGLTKVQIETLMLQKQIQNGDLTLKEAVKLRGHDGITPGAYYRVLDQARTNMIEALYTMLLCSGLGVVKGDDLRRLVDLVSKAPQELNDETLEQVLALIDALARRIVML